MARNCYLYGEEGKRPLRSTELLAKKFQLSRLQVAQLAPAWLATLRAEARVMSKEFGRCPSQETIAAHEGDVAFLREQVDILEEKLRNIDPKAKGLESYEFIMKQWRVAQERWSRMAGVESALKVSEKVRETVAILEVKKLMEEQAPGEDPDIPKEKPVNGRVFDLEAVVPDN